MALLALAACRHDGGDNTDERALPDDARVLFRDDFSDPSTDWYTGDDPDSDSAYRDGRYRVLVKEQEYYVSFSYPIEEVVEAMRVELDAVQSTGTGGDEVGVVCYAHESANDDAGYRVTISSDESAYVERALEGDTDSIATRSGEDAIRPLGKRNRIRADCIGATREQPAVILLYVNGVRVARAEDDDGFPRFDGVGITASSVEGRTESFYDNLVVSELR